MHRVSHSASCNKTSSGHIRGMTEEKNSVAQKEAPAHRIINSDMSEELQKEAVATAGEAFEKFPQMDAENDVANYIKSAFDKQHGGQWHCIVGINYGSTVTHDKGSFVYFYITHHEMAKAVLLFKCS